MFLRLIKVMWVVLLLGFVSYYLFMVSIYNDWNGWYGGMPDYEQLENPRSALSSELYSADRVLLGKYYRTDRVKATYEELSPNLINALVATEDIRFQEHSGIDLMSLARVAKGVLTLNTSSTGGGSTVTQQLAKKLFDTRYDSTLRGSLYNNKLIRIISIKMKEWILAAQIERAYTKKEILTMYFNTVDFGSNAFGVKVASKTYFNKEPINLNVQEAAVLVGLQKAITYYSPILNYDNSLRRRNVVLKQMEKYGYLTATEYDSISKLPIDLNSYKVENHNTGSATYFRTVVRNFALNWCKENGYDLFEDGLKIYTTLNSKMQVYAEEAVKDHLSEYQKIFFKHWEGRNPWIDQNFRELKGFLEKEIQKTERYRTLKNKYGKAQDSIEFYLNKQDTIKVFTWDTPTFEKDTVLSPMDSLKYYKHFLHAGMMSMDPYTGHIKAWVGGINHKYFQYDHVKQGRRQPGSTFKPIVYAAAINEKGFHPCFSVVDVPIAFDLPTGETWTPVNSGPYTGATLTLRQAMAQSVNTVAAYLMKEMNPATVIRYARNMGITSPLDSVPALCLGVSDVSVYDMVGAYGTFVNRGVWTEPIFITHIEDKNGKVIYRQVPKNREVLSEEAAYIMTYMLRGALEEKKGTALRLWQNDFKKDNHVGGKTGTTSNYSDAWFMGITKELVTGVWVGAEDRSVHFRSLKYGQGGRQAMPIFANYTEKVYADESLGYTKGVFPEPATGISIELDCSKYLNPASQVDSLHIIPTKKDDKIMF